MVKTTNLILLSILFIVLSSCKQAPKTDLQALFENPPESAKPWVFWYWIKASVSKAGITADLEAMQKKGIGGAYLIPIQGAENPPLFEPLAEQLTPEWFQMVEFAFKESKRLGLKIAMHSCDGFAVAGGPWITPEMSMQKIVWSELQVQGGQKFNDTLPKPESVKGYYNDIALFAYPAPEKGYASSTVSQPKVTSNMTNQNLDFLLNRENTEVFKSITEGWIQYAFNQAFTCRNIEIRTKNLNYPANRLIVESSMDGVHFDSVCRLEPARHGWQDYEAGYSHTIPATTAKYFRFSYTINGSEPGSEDIDAARWSTALKLQGIHLSEKPVLHQINAKNGTMWRIAKQSNKHILPDSNCIPLASIIDLSAKLDSNGLLTWNVPKGNWNLLRIGHTSTGHTNYIGGKGLGLECDKFDPKVVAFQFDQWFGKIYNEVGADLSKEILKVFHVDSWECGSQNWSPIFASEFKKRRGYNLHPYLPIITGVPLKNAAFSEQVLHDVRTTIDELITDNFFGTMAAKAKGKGCVFSSESVAPVMVSDAMTHFKNVDIPMGEFWFNSPTHDKPNDVLDAISAAHIYGKNIVQSEAFTTLRMDWNEHPAMLKTLGDRNFAWGINRFVFHVFVHNSWVDKKPGMTMNTVGLYFQRDQTWWEQGKAWIDYIQRCQTLLQQGTPVIDVAVFTGEEYPRRALTPDRLVGVLPGLIGCDKIKQEEIRLKNEGAPVLERPYSVNSSANTFDPANWVDPLSGYKYDSFNKDALLHLAKVQHGSIVLPGGQSYNVLIVPGKRKASPNGLLSKETADKFLGLVKAGATIIIDPSNNFDPDLKDKLSESFDLLFNMAEGSANATINIKQLGKGRIIQAPYLLESLNDIGIERDFIVSQNNKQLSNIAWTHRTFNKGHIYFISNQYDKEQELNISLRAQFGSPEIFNPQTGEVKQATQWQMKNGRTQLSIKLAANESSFIVLQGAATLNANKTNPNWNTFNVRETIKTPWELKFDTANGGVKNPLQLIELADWTTFNNDSIRYFSGTALYTNKFNIKQISDEKVWLDLGTMHHIATVFINDKNCGVVWTAPYRVEITAALTDGENKIRIELTNTWKNRILGDNTLKGIEPETFTTAPFRLKNHALVESGLLGPVSLLKLR